MNTTPEMDELAELALADIPEALRDEADPEYLARLGSDLRARHARTNHRLGWFDHDLPVGTLRLIHDGRLVHFVTNRPAMFEHTIADVLGFEPGFDHAAVVERDARLVLAGRHKGADLAYLGELPAFQRQVLRVTASIPRGEVRNYGWVARRAGAAAAVRATGTALGHNPVPFVVPCHRVVRADWSLGQYSAGGPSVKDSILRWEGVDLVRIEQLASTMPFVALRGDTTFCLPACGAIAAQPAALLTGFRTAQAALDAGLAPCPACHPL
jgi:O-6-methylguanine DNA methyltransferase